MFELTAAETDVVSAAVFFCLGFGRNLTPYLHIPKINMRVFALSTGL